MLPLVVVLECGISASVDNKSRVIARGRRGTSPRQQVQHGSVSNNSGQMADASARAEEENIKARKRVRSVGASLIARSNKKTLAILDEKRGSRGYAKWRRQLLVLTASAGVDFLVALHMQREIGTADEYTEEQMLLDDARGISYLTMPQIRQGVLLALI